MRHVIFVCLALGLCAFLGACSPALSPDVTNPDVARPEAVSPSPTADSPAIPSRETADRPEQSLSEESTSALPDSLVQRLKSFLAAETGIRDEAIALKQAQSMEWNNACLEVSSPEELCAEVITPGYRVVLDTPKGEYVVHTDRSGQAFRLAQNP